MPRMNERERLADLEAKQRKVAQEIDEARRALRGRYAVLVAELDVEKLSEREFREVIDHAIRAGGAASLNALKTLPKDAPPSPAKAEKRP